MNIHLINHIDTKIASMSNFVLRYMPINLTVDSAYEEILACSALYTPAMINAFKEGIKYLSPTANFTRFDLVWPDNRIIRLQAKLTSTQKWGVFLRPAGDLVINPESKFAALLDTPVRVATDWENLTYVWEKLRQLEHELDCAQLAYLMPWIRECLVDFNANCIPSVVSRAERKVISKEYATIMQDNNVLFFPRMSKALSNVTRSGRTLIAQFHMIEASYNIDTFVIPPIHVERSLSLIETWLKDHIAEALEQWNHDKNERSIRRWLAKVGSAKPITEDNGE